MKKNILTPTTFLVLLSVTIYFCFNASALDNSARKSLDTISQQAKSFNDYTIYLSGHTDNIGSDRFNDKLSKERAIAVKNYLISKNIDSTKIKFDFYGERNPAVPNTSDSNRTLNRRVEITISGQKMDSSSVATTLPEQQIKDAIKSPKKDNSVILPEKKEVKKKKNRRRLIWTGWKTGFHWSTA